MSTPVLLLGNDQTITVTGLQDQVSGAYLNASTVTATIDTLAGTELASITLQYVTDSNGDYQGVIEDDVAITSGTRYVVDVTATSAGDLVGNWREVVVAKYREFA